MVLKSSIRTSASPRRQRSHWGVRVTQDAYSLLLTHTKQLLLVTVCDTLAGSGVRFQTDARRTMFEIGPKRSETLVGILCSSWHSKTLVGNHFEDFEL